MALLFLNRTPITNNKPNSKLGAALSIIQSNYSFIEIQKSASIMLNVNVKTYIYIYSVVGSYCHIETYLEETPLSCKVYCI